jgi:hypothetical protein
MTIENQIRLLTWTVFLLWGIIAANCFVDFAPRLLAEALVGHAFEEGLVWTLIQITLLVLIPIAYFFAVRRLQWNLPPEEHITDTMNIKNDSL